MVSATFIVAVVGLVRYLTWHKVRRELIVLKSQQALERERLRIAQDIHDDLGARVTQISLLSAMAQDNSEFSEKARLEFAQVSQMSRDLVAALYETVWAVNPENDNLDAMGNYICQMVTMLCERSQLRCRFYVSDLPKNPQVSSQSRHNLSMVVKEAVHNVIKHAKASEVVIRIEFTGEVLHISISDDGCGFQIAEQASGHGLINMKRRLEDIGGTCSIRKRGWQRNNNSSAPDSEQAAGSFKFLRPREEAAMMPKKTVIIVEDNRGLRDQLMRILGSAKDIQCLGAFVSGETALPEILAKKPDVVLMDIKLPGMSGIQCVAEIKKSVPNTHVIMVTVYEDSERIFRALKAGANGYLIKSGPPEQLLEYIRDVYKGGAPMSSHISRKVVQHFHLLGPSVRSLRTRHVSRRYSICSRWVSFIKKSGSKLNISSETVRTYVKNICQKMHVRSRMRAVAGHRSSI